MQRFSWLSARTSVGTQPRSAAARRASTRFRPQLSMLEHRELLSFAAPVAYASNQPQGLVAADVNGDGRSDLVNLTSDYPTIAVRLTNPNGSLGPENSYFTGDANLESHALALANQGGGKVEGVVGGFYNATSSNVPSPISLVSDTGNGSFNPAGTYYNIPNTPTIDSLTLADVYGNSALEVVAGSTGGSVYMIEPGVHAYTLPLGVRTFVAPVHVAVGDFNGDGKTDIVAAGGGRVFVFQNNGSALLFPNNPNGNFGAPQNYTVGGDARAATAVAVGDFNHDGKPDIVTANSNSTISVLLNKGDGTFGAAVSYAIAGPGNAIAVGDWNHDGYLDVATSGSEMDVLLNNGNSTFGAYQKVGPAGNSLVTGDFNGDGFLDLAQVDASPNSIDVVQNTTGGAPAGPVSVSLGSITYNSTKKLFSETVMLTNTTNATLMGPLSLGLTGLPDDVVLTNATGITNGSYYFRFLNSGKALKKGASVTITLTFTAASQSEITFGTEVVPL
jgi:hypothetical protein